MTYIVGWKSKENVFVSGDTALTYTKMAPPITPLFTGLLDIKTDKNPNVKFVGAVKVKKLNNKLIIGFCGVVNSANEFTSYLRRVLLREEEYDVDFVKKCIDAALQEIPDAISNDFIFGFMDKTEPVLLTYTLKEGIKSTDYAHFGSGKNSPWHKKEFEDILKEAATGKAFEDIVETPLNENDKLIIINSIIRSALLLKPMVTEGVGGIFLGMRVDKNGTHWQPSVLQFAYDKSLKEGNRSIFYFKDGILFVQGTDGNITVLSNSNYFLEGDTPAESMDAVLDPVKRKTLIAKSYPDRYDYLVFYSKDGPMVVILRTDEKENGLPFVKFKDMHSPSSPIGVSQVFQQILCNYSYFDDFNFDENFMPVFQFLVAQP